MKRILTIICAIAFSGAALSAQNNADTIKVSRNESDTLVIIVKSKQPVDRQAKKEQRIAEKALKPAYMINVGYSRGYRADIELSQSTRDYPWPYAMGIHTLPAVSIGRSRWDTIRLRRCR